MLHSTMERTAFGFIESLIVKQDPDDGVSKSTSATDSSETPKHIPITSNSHTDTHASSFKPKPFSSRTIKEESQGKLIRLTPMANRVMLEHAHTLQSQKEASKVYLYREGFPLYDQDIAQQAMRYDAQIEVQLQLEKDERLKKNPILMSYAIGHLFELVKVGRCDDFSYLAIKKWIDDRNKRADLQLRMFEYQIVNGNSFDNHYFLLMEPKVSSLKSTTIPEQEHPTRKQAVDSRKLPETLRGGLIVDLFLNKNIWHTGSPKSMNSAWDYYLSQVSKIMGHRRDQDSKTCLIQHCQVDNELNEEECFYAKRIAEQLLISYVLKDCETASDEFKLLIDLKKLPLLPPHDHYNGFKSTSWTSKDIRDLIRKQCENRIKIQKDKSSKQSIKSQRLLDTVGLVFAKAHSVPPHNTETLKKIPNKRLCSSDENRYFLKRRKRIHTEWLDGNQQCVRHQLKIPRYLEPERIRFYSDLVTVDLQDHEQIKDLEYNYAKQIFWGSMVMPNLKMIRYNPHNQQLKDEFLREFYLNEDRLNLWLQKYDMLQEQKEETACFTQLILSNMSLVLEKSLKHDYSASQVSKLLPGDKNTGRDKVLRELDLAISCMKESLMEDRKNGNSQCAKEMAKLFGISVDDVKIYPELYDKVKKENICLSRRKREILHAALRPQVQDCEDVARCLTRERRIQRAESASKKKGKVYEFEVRSQLSGFIHEVRENNKKKRELATTYRVGKDKIQQWVDNIPKFERMLSNPKKTKLEKISASDKALLRDLQLNYFQLCQSPNSREFKDLLKEKGCINSHATIAFRLGLLKVLFLDQSDDNNRVLIRIGFRSEDITQCRMLFSQPMILPKRLMARSFFEILFNSKESVTLEQSYKIMKDRDASIHDSDLTDALRQLRDFSGSKRDKASTHIAKHYSVTIDQAERWVAALDQRNSEFDPVLQARKLRTHIIAVRENDRSNLAGIAQAKNDDHMVHLEAGAVKSQPIAESSQSYNPLSGINDSTKLDRNELLDRFFGENSRPLQPWERKFLIQHCEVTNEGSVLRWLSNFKKKAQKGPNTLTSHYGINSEKAKVWYQNRHKDTLNKKAADRAMLLKTFAQAEQRMNRRRIAEIVSESHPQYSGRMGDDICKKWVKDQHVKQRNIEKVCKSYGFESYECEMLLNAYHGTSLSSRNVDKEVLSQAVCNIFDSLYGDSKKELRKSDVIRQYLDSHDKEITESQLTSMCAKFESLVKDRHNPEAIAESLSQDIDDIRRWIRGFDNICCMRKNKLDRKTRLYQHLWRDEEPRLMSDVARELGEDVPWARGAYTTLRTLFDNDTSLSEISISREIPVDTLRRWKSNYMAQKSKNQ